MFLVILVGKRNGRSDRVLFLFPTKISSKIQPVSTASPILDAKCAKRNCHNLPHPKFFLHHFTRSKQDPV